MKTIQVHRHGPPDVLVLVEMPIPVPGPDEVLVRAHSIGVGIPDIAIRAGTYRWMSKLPVVPGTELSGTVEAVGRMVTGFRPGDRVLVSARERTERGGCYAEFVCVSEDALFLLPASIDLAAAATLSNYQLVRLLLTDAAGARAGQTALVHAAAGGVGSALVEVASSMGLTVIGVARGEKKTAFVKGRGAAHVIDRESENIAEALQRATGGGGVDLVFDPVGGPAFAENIKLLGHLGRVISFGALAGPPTGDLLAVMREHRNMNPSVSTFSIHAYDSRREHRRAAMTWAIDQLEAQSIRPAIHARLPLAEAKSAHEMLEGGGALGKILLQP